MTPFGHLYYKYYKIDWAQKRPGIKMKGHLI